MKGKSPRDNHFLQETRKWTQRPSSPIGTPNTTFTNISARRGRGCCLRWTEPLQVSENRHEFLLFTFYRVPQGSAEKRKGPHSYSIGAASACALFSGGKFSGLGFLSFFQLSVKSLSPQVKTQLLMEPIDSSNSRSGTIPARVFECHTPGQGVLLQCTT